MRELKESLGNNDIEKMQEARFIIVIHVYTLYKYLYVCIYFIYYLSKKFCC